MSGWFSEGRRTRLIFEAQETVWIGGKGFGKNLDGDVATECGVAGAKNFAHSAFTHSGQDFVRSESYTRS